MEPFCIEEWDPSGFDLTDKTCYNDRFNVGFGHFTGFAHNYKKNVEYHQTYSNIWNHHQ